MKKSLNMLEGNITELILLFFLPILCGSLFQQLYNTVDAIVVGNFVGKEGNYIAGSLNNELVVCDKNIITGYDVNSLKMCLANLIQKIKI